MGATASNAASNTARADKVDRATYGPGNATVTGSGVDWTQCTPHLVTETIAAVTACGDGISFARGRRGDWLSVTVLADGDRPRWVTYDAAEMDRVLREIGVAARKRLK